MWIAVVIAIMVIAFQPISPYFATVAFLALFWGSFIMAVLKVFSWLNERQQRALEIKRLASDADYQHAAWNAGDDRIAVYGRFQP